MLIIYLPNFRFVVQFISFDPEIEKKYFFIVSGTFNVVSITMWGAYPFKSANAINIGKAFARLDAKTISTAK